MKNLNDQIKVGMFHREGVENDGKTTLTIEMSDSLIINSNNFEVLQALELTNPVGWLRALADVLENIQTRNNNG